MPGLKVTRELHSDVIESLKTMGVTATADKHSLSHQTVRRIKKGRSYIGYKRVLAADHEPGLGGIYFHDNDDTPFIEEIPIKKPSLLHRFKMRRK
jgi:hypothetical protein